MSKKIPNINARDFSIILNINPYQTPYQLLEAKVENKHQFFGNKFTDHGNRYESLGLKIYEKESGNKVDSKQFNSKHPKYEWITGRFDGVTEIDINTSKTKKRKKIDDESQYCIVEVKCPLKNNRSEPLTLENIPKYYWAQCQVYMNMLDCEVSHYVEYYIKPNGKEDSGILYYLTIYRDNDWWTESLPKIKIFYEEVKKYCILGSLDTHPVRIAEKLWQEKLN